MTGSARELSSSFFFYLELMIAAWFIWMMTSARSVPTQIKILSGYIVCFFGTFATRIGTGTCRRAFTIPEPGRTI